MQKTVYELCSKTKNLPEQSCLPTAVFLNHQTQNSLKNPNRLRLGLLVLPLFEDSKIDLGVVDDVTVSESPPWSQPEAHICLSLTKLKKDCTSPEVYKQAFLEIMSQHQIYVQIFTDGSKVDEKVAAAAVSSVAPNSPFSCQLRDHCSTYTAELQALLFALKQAYQSWESKFIIFPYSLSAL